MEELPGEESLSLRAVAREAGVSAPSIYLHFPDKAALVLEVLRRRFAELATALDTAARGSTDARDELLARSLAYCAFADEHPGSYRVMFASVPSMDRHPDELPGPDLVAANARLMARCGVSDPMTAASLLWCGLHGLITLRQTKPLFPWADRDTLIRRLLTTLVPQDSGQLRSR